MPCLGRGNGESIGSALNLRDQLELNTGPAQRLLKPTRNPIGRQRDRLSWLGLEHMIQMSHMSYLAHETRRKNSFVSCGKGPVSALDAVWP